MVPLPAVLRLPTASCLLRWMLAPAVACLPGMGAAAAAEPGLPAGVTARPFAPPSGPAGATMFVSLPPERTGIDATNNYGDPRMWWERYREFTLGAIGTGIAAGDFDGDGRVDLYIVNKTGGSRLWRNLGDFRFEDATERAGVGTPPDDWCQGAAAADVNNDGWLDLYVCRFRAPNLLFLNRGDGTFREAAVQAGLAIDDASGMGAFADYDRDGWLDLYLQTNVLDAETRPNGQRDYLFRNRGDGTFDNVTDRAGIRGETQGHSATWWDHDNDGWPDLYIANDFKDPDTLYHNNGNGTFTNVLSLVVPHTPQSSMGADQGDVNNDGFIDLFVADMATTTHEKDQRGMAKLRAGTMEDLANPRAAPQYMRNVVFLNTNTGFCLEAAWLTGLVASDWTWSPRFEDLDNDGRLDFHVTNGMVRELHNTDVVARMMATENIPERVRIMKASPVLAETNLAFRNLGDLRFEPVGAAWGLDKAGVSFGSAWADLDGDGDLDLAHANYHDLPSLYRNDSPGGHRLIVSLRGTRSNRFGVGATVRLHGTTGMQVRQLVLARGYGSTSEPVLHFGLGGHARVPRLVVSWPGGHEQVLEDLAADFHYTIVEPAGPPPALEPPVAVARRRPPGRFTEIGEAAGLALEAPEPAMNETAIQPLVPWRLDRFGPGVAIGDLDGDGQDDVVLGGATGSPPQMMLGFGPGAYVPEISFSFGLPTATAWAAPLLFDLDADGDQDLLLPHGGVARPAGDAAYQPQLLINAGRGRFRPAPEGTLPELRFSAGPGCAADFDRDGRLDVFLGGRVTPGRYPLPPRSALLRNRDGRLVDVTATLAPDLAAVGMVHGALWSDVDDDGWPDLLLALEWGPVRYLHNNAGAGFEDRSERAGFAAAGAGWWHSLAAADFNGDGRLDYAAGNLGLNTRYRASPERPARLYFGELEPGAGPRLLEAYYEGDRLLPVRELSQLGAAMPSLRRRFPVYDVFARATLPEIVAPAALEAAQRFAATELRSGVFLSQPDGTYAFQPLPRLAQIAPIYGIAAGDFDGDGRADLHAVQNSYAPIAEVGRFDGGLGQLLAGDGRGGFTPVPLAESGLIVPNDAKALAVLDVDADGWPDFFTSRNNDRTLVHRNGGVPGRRSFAVALRGPAGNPTAIGARVTVELTGGARQTAEMAAGSGYLAQSSASLFFGYPEDDPPRQMRVRWPSGTLTVHDWPGLKPRLTLSAPPE